MQEPNDLHIIIRILEGAKSPEERRDLAAAIKHHKHTEFLREHNSYIQANIGELLTTVAIHFSYAWGDDGEKEESREKIVNELYDTLNNSGYKTQRDRMDLGYKGLISDFMKMIGKGNLIIVAISRKYLKSPYCMFELYEIYRNSKMEREEFVKRIFPVYVENINLKDSNTLKEYLGFWKEEKEKWKNLNQEHEIGEMHIEYRKADKIYSSFSDLMSFISDINALSPKLLSQDNFREIKNAIDNRIKEL